jgi:Leucine-rich repeat (LRR) protein
MPSLDVTDGIKPIEQLCVMMATNGGLVKSGLTESYENVKQIARVFLNEPGASKQII